MMPSTAMMSREKKSRETPRRMTVPIGTPMRTGQEERTASRSTLDGV